MPSGRTPGALQQLPGVGTMMGPAFKTAEMVGGFLGKHLGGSAPDFAGPGSAGFESRGLDREKDRTEALITALAA